MISSGGVSPLCPYLDSTPYALAQVLTLFINDVTENAITALESWQTEVDKAIDDEAVTKHSRHIEAIIRIQGEIEQYISGFNAEISTVIAEFNKAGGNERINAYVKDVHCAAKGRKPSGRISSNIIIDAEEADKLVGIESADRILRPYLSAENHFDFSKLTDNEKYMITREFASHYTRKSVIVSIGLSSMVTEGALQELGVRGTLSWSQRLAKIKSSCEEMSSAYQTRLDEKRNFWSFVLACVSIVTFPFAVMTGYFGMNFENMAGNLVSYSIPHDVLLYINSCIIGFWNRCGGMLCILHFLIAPGHVLTDDYWSSFPGSDFFWIMNLFVYVLLFALALHYELLYSIS